MKKSDIEDTIVALSTPPGEGGIGIVRLSGPEAFKIADRIFAAKDGTKPSKCKTYTVHYGHIIDRDKGQGAGDRGKKIVDEVLLTIMRSPKTYTKEDVVEINCHGGIQATKRVLELVIKCGARVAEPGEFTKRAFLNGRIDLTQAEAVVDVISAKTESSLKVALDQLEGELSKRINSARDAALEIASHVEASIDFPDEALELSEKKDLSKKIKGVMKDLRGLVSTYGEGAILREGILAIICGKPNVGKSSLMNLLLKRDRVIVSPIPGTTRDAIEETINIKGIPIRLVDTAGISKAKDSLEGAGIAKSKKYLALADIALLVIDASTGIDKKDLEIIKLVGNKKRIVIVNKIDIAADGAIKDIKKLFRGETIAEISVTDKTNIAALEQTIADAIWHGSFHQGESAVVSNVRHKELLDKALGNMLSVDKAIGKNASPELIAVDLKEAIYRLGLITGRSVSDDILDRIFERFCIGK